ncbi:hypothetical protein ACP4OV_010240 [Aristida adscensionis]
MVAECAGGRLQQRWLATAAGGGGGGGRAGYGGEGSARGGRDSTRSRLKSMEGGTGSGGGGWTVAEEEGEGRLTTDEPAVDRGGVDAGRRRQGASAEAQRRRLSESGKESGGI